MIFYESQKAKSSTFRFFYAGFLIGLVYLLLEFGVNESVPIYIVIPLAFGTFFNPFIFLLEATPLYKAGFGKPFYIFLKALSPTSLFFSWFVLLFQYLPIYYSWLLAGFAIFMIIAFLIYIKDTKTNG